MKSLRWRLIGVTTATFLGVWVGALIYGTLSAVESLGNDIDDLVIAEARLLSNAVESLVSGGQESLDVEGLAKLMEGGENRAYRVWVRGRLVAQTSDGLTIPRPTEAGFFPLVGPDDSRLMMNWRLFYSLNPERHLEVALAFDCRPLARLIDQILFRYLIPAMATLPLVCLALFFGIRRGLAPLAAISGQVQSRSPEDLSPMDIGRAPHEITPLLVAINGLLARLSSALEGEKRFNANAAHELRTPLAAIKIHAQVLQRLSPATGDARQATTEIVQGVNRATHLVEQLLTLARLDPENAELVFAPVQVGHLLERELGSVEAAIQERRLQVDWVLGGDFSDPLFEHPAIESALQVMIRNLIDNALRYAPEGGKIRLRLQQEPEALVLSVENEAEPLSVEDREHLFDRFYRSRRAVGTSGTGLGLAIVRRVVELHRGSIELGEPADFPGVRFSVRLPR